MAWYNGIEGALWPTTLSDMNHMQLLADPYRQDPLTMGQEYVGTGSPFGVWNPRTDLSGMLAGEAAFDMYNYGLSTQAALVTGGPGFQQRPNYYGGGYGVIDGMGISWGVDSYDAVNPRFHDLSHGL